ncbi:Gly-Xaa carboxypeptidase, partial [Phenoliferia sp. Uapishka_3]
MRPPGSDPRHRHLLTLHKYLLNTFPLIHAKLQLEKPDQFALLYTWPGKDLTLKPIVLMAHQDVVPVNPETINKWDHPPFGGVQDSEGFIWGLIAIFAASEKLLADSFEPTRTIIFSFGFNEETAGPRPLAPAILERYGPNGVGFILDESTTSVTEAYNASFARVSVTEKGQFSLGLSVVTSGGHASVPPAHTGIGLLALLLVELEKNRAPPSLENNPYLNYLACAADYGDVDESFKRQVRDPRQWAGLAQELAKDDTIRAYLGTTQAIDLFHAGVKINALPEIATAGINYRLSFSSDVVTEFARITSILGPVVESLDLKFSVNGSDPGAGYNFAQLSILGSHESAPTSPSHGKPWEILAGTIRHVFTDDTVVVPVGMIDTDTGAFWDVSDNIYRFTPAHDDQLFNKHTVNERIHVDAHLDAIHFYHQLIQNTETWTS